MRVRLPPPAPELCKTVLHPEEPIRSRPDRQAPINTHQNPGDWVLDCLTHSSSHPAAEFLGHPLKVPFEHGWGKLHYGRLLATVQSGQLGLKCCPATLGPPSVASSDVKSPLAMVRVWLPISQFAWARVSNSAFTVVRGSQGSARSRN